MTRDRVNAVLAPFGKQVYRVRYRGVMAWSIGPEFMQTWFTWADAVADLRQLAMFR